MSLSSVPLPGPSSIKLKLIFLILDNLTKFGCSFLQGAHHEAQKFIKVKFVFKSLFVTNLFSLKSVSYTHLTLPTSDLV
mgnify:CR=1 FL=1